MSVNGPGDFDQGPSGTWTELAADSISVANDTEVTLATLNAIADGETLKWQVTPRDDTLLNYGMTHDVYETATFQNVMFDTDGGGSWMQKTTTGGQHLLKYRQKSGGAVTVDYVVWKVVDP